MYKNPDFNVEKFIVHHETSETDYLDLLHYICIEFFAYSCIFVLMIPALVYVYILCGIKHFVTVNSIARSFSFSTTRLTLHTLLNVSLYLAMTLIAYTMMELTNRHRTCLQHYELYRATPFLFMANEFLLFVTGLLIVAVAVTYASTN